MKEKKVIVSCHIDTKDPLADIPAGNPTRVSYDKIPVSRRPRRFIAQKLLG